MSFQLGKTPARAGAVTFQMKKYVNLSRLPTPPAEFGHEDLVQNWGILGNATYGDCVWAGAAHETMLWNKEAGHDVVFTTPNVLSDYTAVTGFDKKDPNTDQGTDMQKAASYRLKTGVADADGNRHKISAYLAIEVGNLEELLVAMYVFSANGTGVLVPDSAQDQFEHEPWSVVAGSKVDGGHYVPGMGRRNGLFVFNTWGGLQPATDEWVSRYMDEGLAYVSDEMLNCDKSLDGFDAEQLRDNLAALTPTNQEN
jgi:hypothetical protein